MADAKRSAAAKRGWDNHCKGTSRSQVQASRASTPKAKARKAPSKPKATTRAAPKTDHGITYEEYRRLIAEAKGREMARPHGNPTAAAGALRQYYTRHAKRERAEIAAGGGIRAVYPK